MHTNRTCLPENYSSFFFTDLYKRFPATFIVGEENGKVVGYAMCRIERGIPSFKILGLTKKGHLISIAVLPEYQRRGIGYALMREVMQGMLLYEATECFLEVRVSNTAAINLYEKLGFRIVRTKRSYYANGEDAYLMSRKLPFTSMEPLS
ncbi:MAG: ribosomal protein S18-alanine N-acetyltransferase [Candidatus Bathyarchaeota archaeon]|nr:MAG: ribosomal protein S18-alanine N-acetyltransferase [Candidatus Bathyarchaeota archaeon]